MAMFSFIPPLGHVRLAGTNVKLSKTNIESQLCATITAYETISSSSIYLQDKNQTYNVTKDVCLYVQATSIDSKSV